MGRLRRIIGRMLTALGDFLEERVPERAGLNYDARQMLEGLDHKCDATSFAMARADEKYERLEAELANHEALGRQAEEFMRGDPAYGVAPDPEAAERCIALQLQSARLIEKLKGEYAGLQREAELAATDFVAKRDEVNARVAALPEIQEDLRITALREKIERSASQFSLDSAERSFDVTVRELNVRKKQLESRQLLTADPHAELDRRIRQSLGRKEIDQAMEALRRKIAEGGEVIDVEATVVEDPVAEAQKMLDRPRYRGILPERAGVSIKVPVKVKR